jgi:hypothetical protein
MRIRFILPAMAALLIAACAEAPIDPAPTSKASYIGDFSSTAMPEVVVSIPAPGAPGGFRNLHVVPVALVSQAPGVASSAYMLSAEFIVSRMEGRIRAALSETMTNAPPADAGDFKGFRARAIEKMQKTFDEEFARWTKSDEYKIKIEILSIWFPDEDRPPANARTYPRPPE